MGDPLNPTLADAQETRLSLSRQDFFYALRFMTGALDIGKSSPGSDLLQIGLVSSAIVAYSRPFLTSKGEKASPKLELEWVPRLAWTTEEKELHAYALVLRNRIVAHADDLFRLQFVRSPTAPDGGTHHPVHVEQILIDDFNWKDFQHLCAKALFACSNGSSPRHLVKPLSFNAKMRLEESRRADKLENERRRKRRRQGPEQTGDSS